MRGLLIVWAAFLTTICAAFGQLPLTGVGPGGFGGTAAFQGMADVVAAPLACWSLRACSSALRGNKSVNVCNVADAACADLSTDAVTGNLVITTIGGSSCSVVVCTIRFIYDQIGTGCGGVNCDLSNNTIASRPTLIVSCTNALPCMALDGTQFLSSTNTITQTQPLTVSFVANRTGNTASFADAFYAPLNNVQMGFGNAVNTALNFCGSATTAAATDNSFHAIQTVANGASSGINVDATPNTVNCGANAIAGSTLLIGGTANFLTGRLPEVGIWSGAFTNTNSSNMSANQRSYWGF